MPPKTDPNTRRRWSPAAKAKVISWPYSDGVLFAPLADECGIAPSQIHAWIRTLLDGADQVLARRCRPKNAKKVLPAKDSRIRHLEEVTAELSMEVLQHNKARGAT